MYPRVRFSRKEFAFLWSQVFLLGLLRLENGCYAFSGIVDMPEECDFTNLLCNDSRLLEQDKIIILNIANEMRNRVADGSFTYLNLQHDPVANMDKLHWNEDLAEKAIAVVSSCPKTSPSFIGQQTILQVDKNGIEKIEINDSIDLAMYNKSDAETAYCDVSSIAYEERLTQCAPQKIKERVIRFLADAGLSTDGRKYDNRDFWTVNRYGEPKLTFRRHESFNLGCSFMIRVSKTHYHAYLTCIYCPHDSSLPAIGPSGENCPPTFPQRDEKYEHLCSDGTNEYRNIEKDLPSVVCENVTISTTPFLSVDYNTSATNASTDESVATATESDHLTPPYRFNLTFVTSTCKTTVVDRNKTTVETGITDWTSAELTSTSIDLTEVEMSTITDTEATVTDKAEKPKIKTSTLLTTLQKMEIEKTTPNATKTKKPSLGQKIKSTTFTPETTTSVDLVGTTLIDLFTLKKAIDISTTKEPLITFSSEQGTAAQDWKTTTSEKLFETLKPTPVTDIEIGTTSTMFASLLDFKSTITSPVNKSIITSTVSSKLSEVLASSLMTSPSSTKTRTMTTKSMDLLATTEGKPEGVTTISTMPYISTLKPTNITPIFPEELTVTASSITSSMFTVAKATATSIIPDITMPTSPYKPVIITPPTKVPITEVISTANTSGMESTLEVKTKVGTTSLITTGEMTTSSPIHYISASSSAAVWKITSITSRSKISTTTCRTTTITEPLFTPTLSCIIRESGATSLASSTTCKPSITAEETKEISTNATTKYRTTLTSAPITVTIPIITARKTIVSTKKSLEISTGPSTTYRSSTKSTEMTIDPTTTIIKSPEVVFISTKTTFRTISSIDASTASATTFETMTTATEVSIIPTTTFRTTIPAAYTINTATCRTTFSTEESIETSITSPPTSKTTISIVSTTPSTATLSTVPTVNTTTSRTTASSTNTTTCKTTSTIKIMSSSMKGMTAPKTTKSSEIHFPHNNT